MTDDELILYGFSCAFENDEYEKLEAAFKVWTQDEKDAANRYTHALMRHEIEGAEKPVMPGVVRNALGF